jgi:putative pyruvate formate lyase activating enzyme
MPRYLELLNSGDLRRRVVRAYEMLKSCRVCPRNCGVNRLKGEEGFCRTTVVPGVASVNLHRGEEPPIAGEKGSGTVFFTYCNLKCVFCQNWPLSQQGVGNAMKVSTLAEKMVGLQKKGAKNINFVTPSHVVPQVIHAIYLAARKGLTLPIVYNTSGYDSEESLRLLEGVVDVYLPDYRYSDNGMAKKISKAEDYPDVVRRNLPAMLDQVGHFRENGSIGGLIVRHLILPNNVSGTKEVLTDIRTRLGAETHVSLMTQYFPANKAVGHPLMGRKITDTEAQEAFDHLWNTGLTNGWVQEFESCEPDD